MSGHEVDVGGEGPMFKYIRTKLESEFLTGECSQAFPVFRRSSAPVYYCERKRKVKTGEAWERGYQNTHLTSKTVILAVLALKKNSTHLHSNQPKLSPVSESSTHPLQNYVCFFPLTSRSGSYAHKPTPCHCP